jgi:CBS domain containing-hemolysin-like protein
VAFGIITFLHVVFGELAPKSAAIARPEGTSLFVAPFMRFFYYLFYPGTVVFNGTANAVVRLFGVPPASESDDTHSEDELRLLIEQSTRGGVLDTDEEHMLEAVFDLEETTAREVMVPRPDVVAVAAGMRLGELFSFVAAGDHTRYPVHEDGSPERVVGAVHVRDVVRAVAAVANSQVDLGGGLRSPPKGGANAGGLAREILTVPENRWIDDVLADLQRRGIEMAIIIDEWGSFEGLLTVEDIVEEIIGEIRGEFDEEGPAVRELPDGSYEIDGGAPIREVNEALGLRFESEDFGTVGGVVLGLLGRAPEPGDEVRLAGHVLRVEATDGARVARVIVRRERG